MILSSCQAWDSELEWMRMLYLDWEGLEMAYQDSHQFGKHPRSRGQAEGQCLVLIMFSHIVKLEEFPEPWKFSEPWKWMGTCR